MNPVIVSVGSVRGELIDCPAKIEKKISEACSYQAFNFQFSDAYLNGHWDGYIKKYSLKTHSFSSGLMYRVAQILKNEMIDYEIVDSRTKFTWNEKQVLKNLSKFKFQLRPYQIDGLIRGLNVPYMVYWWATSSGKTVQFAALISALKRDRYRRTLILVANKDLASQHRKELGEMLDEPIGLIEEGRFEPKPITVAVINTLWIKGVKQKNKQIGMYLDKIEHLITDEAHHAIDSKMFKQTIRKCKNTLARHGFSGTPFSLTTDDLELESVTGPPLSKVSMSRLIQEGWVSVPHIYMFKYNSLPVQKNLKNYAALYRKAISENVVRNKAIRDIATFEYETFENDTTLIIIKLIDHGRKLKEMIIDNGVDSDDIKFIHGSTAKNVRDSVKEAFKDKELRIVIASSIWIEGIDIPTVNALIMAAAGGGKEIADKKGIRAVIQQIGRVIRKPIKEGEEDVDQGEVNNVRIYDFLDSSHKDVMRHSMNRFLTFKMEEEFKVKEVNYDSWKSKNGII